MSREKDPECRGVLVTETPNALLVRGPKNGMGVSWEHWIPRSQIGYLRKTAREDGGTDLVFTVPEWLLEKKGAWDLAP